MGGRQCRRPPSPPPQPLQPPLPPPPPPLLPPPLPPPPSLPPPLPPPPPQSPPSPPRMPLPLPEEAPPMTPVVSPPLRESGPASVLGQSPANQRSGRGSSSQSRRVPSSSQTSRHFCSFWRQVEASSGRCLDPSRPAVTQIWMEMASGCTSASPALACSNSADSEIPFCAARLLILANSFSVSLAKARSTASLRVSNSSSSDMLPSEPSPCEDCASPPAGGGTPTSCMSDAANCTALSMVAPAIRI
mmetsp:Transcript_23849/g.78496  ORF Transcript_23849/g.78496 Transcript_23849/m.78496 type:complete len:246 (+) Transcript_23849:1225-1962(+)